MMAKSTAPTSDPPQADGGDPPPPDAADLETGPLRRCIVSHQSRPQGEMLRFVVSPDGDVVFDAAGKLPGRGLWLSAGADMLQTAATRGAFAKAHRGQARAPGDLGHQVARQLRKRCLDRLGLARRAGQLVAGFEKVRTRMGAPKNRQAPAVVIEASDGAADGRDKLRRLVGDVPVVALFEARELGQAIGRDNAVHAVMDAGQLADGFLQDAEKLARVLNVPLDGVNDGTKLG